LLINIMPIVLSLIIDTDVTSIIIDVVYSKVWYLPPRSYLKNWRDIKGLG
jgi:hypothetical protein